MFHPKQVWLKIQPVKLLIMQGHPTSALDRVLSSGEGGCLKMCHFSWSLLLRCTITLYSVVVQQVSQWLHVKEELLGTSVFPTLKITFWSCSIPRGGPTYTDMLKRNPKMSSKMGKNQNRGTASFLMAPIHIHVICVGVYFCLFHLLSEIRNR